MAKAVARRFDVQLQTPNYGGLYAGGKFVRLATAADLNGAYTYSGATKKITGPAVTALANIDSTAPAVGDRILVKNAATGSNNGLYVVNALGGAGAYELERDFDFDASGDAKGAWGLVTEGTANGGGIFRCTNTGAVTLDTTALTFSITVPGSAVTAGAGLTDTAGTFAVVSANTGIAVGADDITLTLAANSGLEIVSGLKLVSTVAGAGLTLTTGVLAVGAGNGITVNADDIALATTAAGAGLTYTTGVLAVVSGNTAIVANADDITLTLAANSGLEIASGLKVDLDTGSGMTLGAGGLSIASGGVTQSMLQQTAAAGSVIYSALIGDGTATSIAVTHNMGTRYCLAQVYDVDTSEQVGCNVIATSTTVTTFEFGSAPAINKRKVVLMAVA